MYKTRAVFIGSNPSAASKGLDPFNKSTKSGRTLHEWISKAEVNISVTMNLSNKKTPNNRPLKMSEIKDSLRRLELNLKHYGMKPVAVGKAAATALRLLGVDFYEMPHSSGLNRQLNDPKYIEEKINGLKEYLLSPFKIES